MAIDTCAEAGATFGAGDLMFIAEGTCLLDVLENLLEFFEHESCGKCTPCREGTSQLLDLVRRFKHNTARSGDLELLVELANFKAEGSLCGLGQASPNPVLSTVRFFPNFCGKKRFSREAC